MLKDSFFTVKEIADIENGRIYRLVLNASHAIFQAHFAGNPVMPGACIVQIIKELSSDYFGKIFFTEAVKNMKFLHVINPLESPEISALLTYTEQEDEHVLVSAILKNDHTIFSKSSLILKNIKD
ncbi:MAG: hypothetical protein LBG96_17890 [Tannerella sp.]|jgi:3-hydroxyacyl-[acyl-carrier-protein] dehydratase|nr:hypothetical protein [Tannerella sp.]